MEQHSCRPNQPSIKKKIKHPNVANAFNTFFLTITGKLNAYEVVKVGAYRFPFYKIRFRKIP